MITLSKSGNSVTFTFDENSGYLQNGTIDVPVNSLSLITDESDMATFRKSASNDIFISARYEEFGMTKSELESWYKENMVGSTGGGGGVTSGEVQTMIDESISGLAESSAVTQEISAAVSGKIDSDSAVTDVRVLTVSQQNELQIVENKGGSTASTFVGTVYRIGSGLTWDYQTKNIAINGGTVQNMIDESTNGYADTVIYNPTTKYVEFYHKGTGGTKVYEYDASPFLIDGMVQNVEIKDATPTETLTFVSDEDFKVGIVNPTANTFIFEFNDSSYLNECNITLYDTTDDSGNYAEVEWSNGNINISGSISATATTSGNVVTITTSSGIVSVWINEIYYSYLKSAKIEYPSVTCLVISFNTDAGKQDINIPLTEIFDPSNYYTKTETNTLLGGKADTATTYTKTEVDNAITAATSTKQDQLSAGTNITIDANNVISAVGGISSGEVESMISAATSGFITSEDVCSIASEECGFVDVEGVEGILDEGGYLTEGDLSENQALDDAVGEMGYLKGSDLGGNPDLESAVSNLGFISGEDVGYMLENYVPTSAITSAVTSASTSSQVPSAKYVYDKFDEVEQVTAAALNNINDRLSEDEEVTAAGLNALNDKFDGMKLKKISQTDYDNLQTKDSNTLYVIVN